MAIAENIFLQSLPRTGYGQSQRAFSFSLPILVLLLAACVDVRAQEASLPRLGSPLPQSAQPAARFLPSVLSLEYFSRSYLVMSDSLVYWLAAASAEETICGVYIWDLRFATPEGVRAGWPRAALKVFGPAWPSPWETYDVIRLPSQWYAALPRFRRLPRNDAAPRRIDREPAVEFLFRENLKCR